MAFFQKLSTKPAFNKPGTVANPITQGQLAGTRPQLAKPVYNKPGVKSVAAPMSAPPPKPAATLIPKPVMRPAANPAGAPKYVTNRDLQYLQDRQQLDRGYKGQNAELQSLKDALTARGPDGLTTYERMVKGLAGQRSADESSGHAGLAGNGMLFSGQRDSMDSQIGSAFVADKLAADAQYGSTRKAEIDKTFNELLTQYRAATADLEDQAKWRSTEAGGPALVAKPKPRPKPVKKPKPRAQR